MDIEKEKASLIKEIKLKKELSGISDVIIKDLLDNLLKNISLCPISKNDKKIIIKDIRKELRLLSGRFKADSKDPLELLKEGKISALLKSHASTKERLDTYPFLSSLIKKLKVNSIIDIGCGINPIALASPNILYNACDINEQNLNVVKEYFKKNKINGNVFYFDIRKDEVSTLPKSDICLIMKLFDIIEKKGHKLAEETILKLNSKYILVSFSTKKLSGKPMQKPKRKWFELMLNRLNLPFEYFEKENEVFYLIKKI